MAGVAGNIAMISRTAHEKVKKERNVIIKDLQMLKETFSLTLQETESLEKNVASLNDEIAIKNAAVENLKMKYTDVKEKNEKLKDKISRLEKEADTNNSTINNLIRAKKSLEEQKKQIRRELEKRTNAYLHSKLKQDGVVLHSNRNSKGYYSAGSNAGSNNRYYRISPYEYHHRR